jgi:hypothetical protein
LVQAFLKKWWVESDFKAPNLPLSLEWRVELSDTILKWEYTRTIPARFGLIWFSGFRGKDLNVIFYQKLKIEISSIVHCCFIINQNELKY